MTELQAQTFGVDVSARVEELAADLGRASTSRLGNLEALFDEKSDPTLIEIFGAWHGISTLPTSETNDSRTSRGAEMLFDPATDTVSQSGYYPIKDAYDRAVAAEMEDVAELLRTLPFELQQSFAAFLRRGYLPKRQ